MMYSTLPAVLLLGLVSTWLIVPPEPALAPVIPPLIAPIDQLNVLPVEEANTIFGEVPLHVTAVEGFVTAGVGLTVTVMTYAALAGQLPVVEVGITKYSTVPAVELLGLMSVCEIVLPLPAAAPVIPPVTVPMVHANVLGAVAVKGILVAVLLQIATVAGTPAIAGVGLTVTVIVYGALAAQLPTVEVGVTRYWTVPAVVLLGLPSVCAMVLPLPALAPVMLPVIVPMVHANVLGAVAVNGILVAVLLQMAAVAGTPVITGRGFTVTVIE
jgi:uncharacterized protein (DUF433 family)